ncbi:MAG: GDP-mannose 4,6-dehydratase [Deltaproteobacteria bacterium]|nr:GDP-mannose 4,6-dehydratase [Deltaproteobacteria bacterium]
MCAHILVTGGAGFIGSHLSRRLLGRGDRVTVLDNFNDFYDPQLKRRNVSAFLDNGNYRLVEGDIRDAALVDQLFADSGFDGVVHLAARAGVRPSLEQPILYEQVNCIGTLNLLEAARRHGPEVFTFGSSSSVYGINEKVPFSEEDEVNLPISPYATTKRAGELMCFNYHHLYGMRISCLRFFTVYGPGQRPEMAIHKFTNLLAKGETIPMFGDGSSRRDYTFIDDIIDGVVAALDQAPGFEIFNLGGAETTSLADLVSWLAEDLKVEAQIERFPDQPGDVPITYAEVSKAAKLLGYSPKVPIREGLRRFVNWYRSNESPAPLPGPSKQGSSD